MRPRLWILDGNGTYDFKHVIFTFCNGSSPEIEGFLAGYRGVSTNLNTYLLSGYPAATAGWGGGNGNCRSGPWKIFFAWGPS